MTHSHGQFWCTEGEGGGWMGWCEHTQGQEFMWPPRHTQGLGDKRGLCTTVGPLLGPLWESCSVVSVHAEAYFTFSQANSGMFTSTHRECPHPRQLAIIVIADEKECCTASISIWRLAQLLTSHTSFNWQRPLPRAISNTSNIPLISSSKSKSNSQHKKTKTLQGGWSSRGPVFITYYWNPGKQCELVLGEEGL